MFTWLKSWWYFNNKKILKILLIRINVVDFWISLKRKLRLLCFIKLQNITYTKWMLHGYHYNKFNSINIIKSNFVLARTKYDHECNACGMIHFLLFACKWNKKKYIAKISPVANYNIHTNQLQSVTESSFQLFCLKFAY